MSSKIMARRNARRDKGVMDIDITSLMDIMVILLVFLLKSYNPSDLFVDITKNMNLPPSNSIDLGEHSVIVRVDKEKRIFVDRTEITEGVSLVEQLKSKRIEVDKYKEQYKKAKDVYLLNLVMDESLEYQELKKVMDVAAEAGFNQFKFIVKSKV
ncbi:MAG: ExbD/TolR family protein [Bacteriovoracaceae bacterium]